MNNEVTLTSNVDKTNAYKSDMQQKKGVTVASKYAQSKSTRAPYCDRARKNAKVTLPLLLLTKHMETKEAYLNPINQWVLEG